MTPDFQNSPREELEARLTALLLGELPANEAFALGRMIVHDAELGKTYERLKQTIKLVKETEAPVPDQVVSAAPMKLSAKNREALLQQFKTLKPKAFAEVAHKWWRQPVKIAAAIVILAVAAFTLGFLITEFGGKSMTEYSATSTLAPADSVNDTYSPSHLT